ncbi:diaminobutyrate acetyltransferase [Streptomyces polyrhachis]|uniref:L-2,4-diaminobutyric acid acetyltransferase n=1 Tax=Streptomyces polyrhachis TaxID=1282885 RepID=A0ABW2GG63_9ACTN
MTAVQADLFQPVGRSPEFASPEFTPGSPDEPPLDRPGVGDGPALWRLARDSGALDLNSSYSYLLWCRDFAATSLVARGPQGSPVAFATGYVRPEAPDTLLVWQVAVDGAYRGRGLAGRLLDELGARVGASHGVRRLETTITPGNTASERLFTAYARRRGAPLSREVLFAGEHFPDGHDPEVLFRIGPFTTDGETL